MWELNGLAEGKDEKNLQGWWVELDRQKKRNRRKLEGRRNELDR